MCMKKKDDSIVGNKMCVGKQMYLKEKDQYSLWFLSIHSVRVYVCLFISVHIYVYTDFKHKFLQVRVSFAV